MSSWLVASILLEAGGLWLTARYGLLSYYAILHMLMVSIFSQKLIAVFGLISNQGCLWYAVVVAVVLMTLEREGQARASRLVFGIYVTLGVYLLTVQFAVLEPRLQGNTYPALDAAADQSWSVVLASVLAFGLAQIALIWTYQRLRGYLLWRYLCAVIIGQAVDSIVFFQVAFGGQVLGYKRIMLDGFVLKVLFGLCFAPVVLWAGKPKVKAR